jgi:cyclopropane fatty-acyl-phospholipid synthase-like methyltransferase
MDEIFNKDYFEDGIKKGVSGYENYRWLPQRIYREIRAVINLLGIEPNQTVLDVGCAKGYWVRGFREYGIKAFGYDISEYAIKKADKKVKRYLSNEFPITKFSYIVSRNTLEHIEAKDLKKMLKMFLKMTDTVFFTVPLIDPRTGDYAMQIPDITHKIRWTNAQWMSFCEKCGWKEVINFNHIEGLHDNFKNYPNAMGFYLLKK